MDWVNVFHGCETLITQVKVDVENDAHFGLKYVRDCSGSHITPFLGNITNDELIQQNSAMQTRVS